MARPSENRTITKRFRVNAAEDKRLIADATEVGMDQSEYYRHRLLTGDPLTTGKGLTRPEFREALQHVTTLQSKLKGLDPDADGAIQRLADLTFKALQDDH